MNLKLILVTTSFVTVAVCAFAQDKKELEHQLAECKTTKDSIQMALTQLTKTYDSIRVRYLEYDTMYQVIKDKYIGFEFDPANLAHIVDSLRAQRDSTLIKSASKALGPDTTKATPTDVAALVAVSEDGSSKLLTDSLQQEINHFRFIFDQYFVKGTIPQATADLNGTWKVSLQWFEITRSGDRSGVNLMPLRPDNLFVTSIKFVDAELAELTLNNGVNVKCFYKVNGFSKDKPYSIDFNKWKEVDNRLFVNPREGELYVSYQKGNGFFHGFMRKQ